MYTKKTPNKNLLIVGSNYYILLGRYNKIAANCFIELSTTLLFLKKLFLNELKSRGKL